MMLYHAINLITGQVTLRVESGFPERVLNLCAARQIPFWDLQWESELAFTFTMTRQSWRRLRALRDRLNYDNVSRCYVVVCGEDNLAQVRVDSLSPSGSGYTLTGSLVYQVDGRVLAKFQAGLLSCDNMFGYAVTSMSITG